MLHCHLKISIRHTLEARATLGGTCFLFFVLWVSVFVGVFVTCGKYGFDVYMMLFGSIWLWVKKMVPKKNYW